MNPRIAVRLARATGWLLTPVVVWAASFLGGWLAALLLGVERGGATGLAWLAGGGVVGGMIGAAGWIGLMVRLGGHGRRGEQRET